MTKTKEVSIRIIVTISIVIIGGIIFAIYAVFQARDTSQSDTTDESYSPEGSSSVLGFPPSISSSSPPTTDVPQIALEPKQSSFITITDSCTYNYVGDCVRVRSGPGLDFPVVAKLRNDMILKIDPSKDTEADGYLWHKIVFDEFLQYPERITSDWYVVNEYTKVFSDIGIETEGDAESTTKRILIDRSEQTLTAYDGEIIVMSFPISTGLLLTPTPRGTFTIFRKTPTRYMQGPLKRVSDQYYDLPGVPWNLYFTEDGAVIHGAYWHNSFGHAYSHGCVNLLPKDAQQLYAWATIGMKVIVQD